MLAGIQRRARVAGPGTPFPDELVELRRLGASYVELPSGFRIQFDPNISVPSDASIQKLVRDAAASAASISYEGFAHFAKHHRGQYIKDLQENPAVLDALARRIRQHDNRAINSGNPNV